MNPTLEAILRTKQVTSHTGERLAVHSSVKRRDGAFLQAMVHEVTPPVRRSLEVGFAFGISTMFLCEALSTLGSGRHIVIDPHQHGPDWMGIGLENIKAAGFSSMVDFREEPSCVALPRLWEQGLTLDFALIDGWTTFDGKLVDFFLIDRVLRVGGVVVVRAGTTRAGMKVCRYIASNRPDYEICGALRPNYEVDGGLPDVSECGIGEDITAFRKLHDDNRSWNFHAEF